MSETTDFLAVAHNNKTVFVRNTGPVKHFTVISVYTLYIIHLIITSVKVVASGPTLEDIMLKTSNPHFSTTFVYTGLDIPNFEHVAAPMFLIPPLYDTTGCQTGLYNWFGKPV